MDFLSSYYVLSPGALYSPRCTHSVFGDLPVRNRTRDEVQLEKMKNGDYKEVREHRKMGERRKTRVHFVASICEESERLESISLTPKRQDQEENPCNQGKEELHREEEKGNAAVDKRVSIFGIRIGKVHTRQ
ncbi:hypothetical protein BWQ96_03333 [Gracilariopsis chorda]|uniref:Uncharacterized protein n=1 Tax=Gracilariopsis chorda TaxID=448386 RepID=A0A2V3IXB9_9FLOR|nr:hypothetical protein BWQ96_03333 [Gracilariopsis chorda]|eukprot:PXF46804.1 hypothetical protein BWQ96_03333 [Gracilariopsis chorda]